MSSYFVPNDAKNSDTFVLNELETIPLDSHFLVSPHSPGGGGLALLWSQEVSLTVLTHSNNFIDALVSFKGPKVHMSFVYGEPDVARRQSVWDAISGYAADRSSPWLLTGDFNEILDNTEKSKGPARPERSFTAFREFIAQNDLFDLQHTGSFLSWHGKQGCHLVHCCLDRTLANIAWYDAFPRGRSHSLKFEGLDHWPVHSTFDATKKIHGRIFHFGRRLKDIQEVRELVDHMWNSLPDSTVYLRISVCRRSIAKWSRLHHMNSWRLIEELKIKLDTTMADQTPDEVIAEINKELLDAYRAEEAFWNQRSRLLWLTLGDKNTGFFYAVSKERKARNRLMVMENEHGEHVYEEEHIAAEIARYFSDIFTTTGTGGGGVVSRALSHRISDEANASLISIPSAKEIKKALFAIHPDKAPGPDGFSASFFQANWDAIGPAIVAEVHEFFITGSMPDMINMTHVRLIPKGQNVIKVTDFRSIAFCNVYYKIISKLLSLRLRPVLSGIISENQSAFLPGRAIADNVLITHEILHYLKTSDARKHCYMAVKTDMSKAYDRLEWHFIRQVLEKLGFDQCF